MNLQGERLIDASRDTTWAALNDPETLKACITGCESLERIADDEYLATTLMRIGPVNARFKGKLKLQNIVPLSSYTIAFNGQGGVAGFGKGTADVTLIPQGSKTQLFYKAQIQVGGKLAQVGSRLIEGAAAKITDDFFAVFERRLAPTSVEGVSAETVAAPTSAKEPPAGARNRRVAWIVAAAVLIALIAYLTVMNASR